MSNQHSYVCGAIHSCEHLKIVYCFINQNVAKVSPTVIPRCQADVGLDAINITQEANLQKACKAPHQLPIVWLRDVGAINYPPVHITQPT